MQRIPVESRTIASIGYASKERVLELEFRQSGEIYQYFDVPATEYTAFLAALPGVPISIGISRFGTTATAASYPQRNNSAK